MANLLKQFGNSSKLEPTLQELAEHLHWISGQERIMRSYADSEQQPERRELEAFADSIVAQDANSVQERLSRMELLVLGSQDLPLRKLGSLELMLQAMNVSQLWWDLQHESVTVRLLFCEDFKASMVLWLFVISISKNSRNTS